MRKDRNSTDEKLRARYQKHGVTGFAFYLLIVIVLFIFWPLGLVLLWYKINEDRKAAMLSANLVTLLGIGLIILGLLALLGFMLNRSYYDETQMFVVIGIMISLGIALIFLGFFLRKNASRFKRYIAIVWNDQITNLKEIGAILAQPYEQVARDLQNMIDKGFFQSAYIDHHKGEIIIPDLPNEPNDNQEPYDIISCRSCGAHKKVFVGRIAACDFCGSRLKA